MGGDEGIEDVEIGLPLAVDLDNTAAFDASGWRRVPWTVEGREARLGVLRRELVVPQGSRIPFVEAAPAWGRCHCSAP